MSGEKIAELQPLYRSMETRSVGESPDEERWRYILNEIAALLSLHKSGEALMLIITALMPCWQQYQEDSMQQEAGLLSLMATVTNNISDMRSIINTGGKTNMNGQPEGITKAQATRFLNDIYTIFQNLAIYMHEHPNNCAGIEQLKTTLMEQFNAFGFGPNCPPGDIQHFINKAWAATYSPNNPKGEDFSQIKLIFDAITNSQTSVTSQSQSAQSVYQFLSTQLNQIFGLTKTVESSSVDLDRTIVQNMRPQ